MKQKQINKAFPALSKLQNFSLPVKKAFAIYKLKQRVEELYMFASGEQDKYISEFNGAPNDSGSIVFDSVEHCEQFKTKLAGLNEIEHEGFDELTVTLTESDLGDARISPSDIEALEGFIIFE